MIAIVFEYESGIRARRSARFSNHLADELSHQKESWG
jgi:hypothetical protein